MENKSVKKSEKNEIKKMEYHKSTVIVGVILLVLIIAIPLVYHLFLKRETCEHLEVVSEITGERAICVDEITN